MACRRYGSSDVVSKRTWRGVPAHGIGSPFLDRGIGGRLTAAARQYNNEKDSLAFRN